MLKKPKIRIELNKGRIGMPLQKLAKVAEESYTFLKMLSDDIDLSKGQWVALNFQNGSVICDIEYLGDITETQRKDCVYYLDKIISDPKQAINGRIRHKTILQYANIAKPLDADEPITFGVYKDDGVDSITYHQLTHEIAADVAEAIEETIEYYGAVRGVIENIFQLGGDKPYLKLRDVLSGKLIDCYFDPRLYNKIHKLLEKRKGLVTFSGKIRANRLERRLESIFIGPDDNMELAEEYQLGDLDKFIGCAPDMLDDMSVKKYMDIIRGRSE